MADICHFVISAVGSHVIKLSRKVVVSQFLETVIMELSVVDNWVQTFDVLVGIFIASIISQPDVISSTSCLKWRSLLCSM